MRPISDKKCPICHAMFPTKVVFCSVCGTELEEEVKELKSTFEFPIDDPSSGNLSRRFFRDEPLETRERNSEFVADETQFAWQVSDTVVPLKMKGDICYSDNFKSPRLRIKQVLDLSIHQMIILGSLGFIISLSLIVFVNITLLLALKIAPITGLTISLAILSFLIISVCFFVINARTTKIIAGWKDKQIKNTKSSFLSYGIIQLTHFAVISLISLAIIKLLFNNTASVSLGYTLFLPSFLITLVITLVSPPFRIAKILSSAGQVNIFQNFQDAVQFPRVSIRRSIQFSLISFLIPALLLLAGASSTSKLFLSFVSPELGLFASTWDYVGISIILLALMVCVVMITFVDVNTFYYYEELIQQYIEPPSLSWMEEVQDEQELQKNYERKDNTSRAREKRCPVCSSLLIEGAEFCTDCGKKVIK